MEKNTGKVREFCHSGKVGTMISQNHLIFSESISFSVNEPLIMAHLLPIDLSFK